MAWELDSGSSVLFMRVRLCVQSLSFDSSVAGCSDRGAGIREGMKLQSVSALRG